MIWEPGPRARSPTGTRSTPSFPDEEISLFGPGTDSGTFDYFTDAINGEEGASRTDYEASEDDNVIVQGVSGTPVRWATSATPTTRRTPTTSRPSRSTPAAAVSRRRAETAQDGTYAPLARPLFIYVSNASYSDKPQVAEFVDFYIDNLRRHHRGGAVHPAQRGPDRRDAVGPRRPQGLTEPTS